MKRIDTHIHGHYSADSNMSYHDLCQKAVENGYSHIAFTEHYDLLDYELAQYGLLPLKKYFKEIEDLRKDFPQLDIIAGIEIGEPHRTYKTFQEIFKINKPEYTIGSLHVTRSRINVSLQLDEIPTQAEIKEYYEENLEMVQIGGFDTLGHLGIYKRGIANPEKIQENHINPTIDEIFREMIKKNMCLEVNNSGFKARINNIIPEPKTLIRYQELGGELITISSDSHYLEHFDKFYEKTLDIIRGLNFKAIYYKSDSNWEKVDII
jgi:histidinol-phosphatase (PHP family)